MNNLLPRIIDTFIGGGKVSPVSNPFTKTCIESVNMRAWRSDWGDHKWNYTGRIQFKNGNTKGEQEFDCESWEELAVKMRQFMEAL